MISKVLVFHYLVYNILSCANFSLQEDQDIPEHRAFLGEHQSQCKHGSKFRICLLKFLVYLAQFCILSHYFSNILVVNLL